MLSDIADYLDSLSIGTVNTDLFYHDWPDSAVGSYDTAMLLRQYAGFGPDHYVGGGQVVDRPGLQAMSRSKTPSTAMANIYAIYDMLDGVSGVDMGDTHVNHIVANQSPAFLYQDDAGRHVWVVNFNVVIAR
jgi:hypothetical protein